MATSFYSTGTVTLTNGSAVVTGNGTLWQAALVTNGLLTVEASGNLLLIASVDSDDQITAEQEWVGDSGTFSYGIVRQPEQLQDNAENSRALSFLISELRNGTLFKYDTAGPIESRALYDNRPADFSFLVSRGLGQGSLYVKASASPGDWDGPLQYGTGPIGPPPELEIGTVTTVPPGDPATALISGEDGLYTLDLGLPQGDKGDAGWAIEPELVAHGSRMVIRVADFIGGEGAKPAGTGLYVGNGGLVANVDDAVSVRGPAGPQGARGIRWRGDWVIDVTYDNGDLVVDVDAAGEPASFISLTQNTGMKPIENPSDWGYFPASVPSTIDDGLWGDSVTETTNDGVWGV